MSVWLYSKTFFVWLWRCARAWIEVGHRLRDLENELNEQATARKDEDQRLQVALTAAVSSAKDGREKIHQRIDELDRAQSDRLAAIDRAQQKRIDDWALQLSGQINQVYSAVARLPAGVRRR